MGNLLESNPDKYKEKRSQSVKDRIMQRLSINMESIYKSQTHETSKHGSESRLGEKFVENDSITPLDQ